MAVKIDSDPKRDKQIIKSMAKEIKNLLGCTRCIFNKDTCSYNCEDGISKYYLKKSNVGLEKGLKNWDYCDFLLTTTNKYDIV